MAFTPASYHGYHPSYPKGPYFIPGYTGHCPQKTWNVGKTYGRTTHEIITAKDVVGERLMPVPADLYAGYYQSPHYVANSRSKPFPAYLDDPKEEWERFRARQRYDEWGMAFPSWEYDGGYSENRLVERPYIARSRSERMSDYEESRWREEKAMFKGFRVKPPEEEPMISRYDVNEHRWVQEKATASSQQRPHDEEKPSTTLRDGAELIYEENEPYIPVMNQLPRGAEALSPSLYAHILERQKKEKEEQKKMAEREYERRLQQRQWQWKDNYPKQYGQSSAEYSGYNTEQLRGYESQMQWRNSFGTPEDKTDKGGEHQFFIHPSQKIPDGQIVAPRLSRGYRSA